MIQQSKRSIIQKNIYSEFWKGTYCMAGNFTSFMKFNNSYSNHWLETSLASIFEAKNSE